MNSIEKFEMKLSEWAYEYCRYIEDDPLIRQYITNPHDAYSYCILIKDRPEIRQYITNSYDAYLYCRNINDDPMIRQYITNSICCYYYCTGVKYIEELAKVARRGGYDI